MQNDCNKEVEAEATTKDPIIPKVPEVPKTKETIENPEATKLEAIRVNTQTADLEDWDDKAFPIMIERADGKDTNEFTTLSIHSADLLVALMTKRLRLATPTGILECAPCVEDHPDMQPLIDWLRAASTSVKSRRSRRQR